MQNGNIVLFEIRWREEGNRTDDVATELKLRANQTVAGITDESNSDSGENSKRKSCRSAVRSTNFIYNHLRTNQRPVGRLRRSYDVTTSNY